MRDRCYERYCDASAGQALSGMSRPRTQAPRPTVQGKLDGLALMDAEADLRRRLVDHGAIENSPRLQHHVRSITNGATTTALRADRLRKVILYHHLEQVIARGGRGSKPQTYSEAFEEVYGEPLITETMRSAATELRRRKP